MKSFADFEIWIPARRAQAGAELAPYEVHVFSSPAGTAVGTLNLNLDDAGFQTNLVQVSGVVAKPEVRTKFGEDLFHALFTSKVLQAWNNSWGRIEAGAAQGLRLCLSIEDAALAYLPWELIHDPNRGFLAVAANSAFSRYLRVPEPPLLVHQKPLRIVVIVESPKPNGLAPISEEEQLSLKAGLDSLGDGVKYLMLQNPSIEEIQNELQKDPHVVHFLGHGTSSQLIFVNKNGETTGVTDEQFAILFLGRRSLRLVVLNACQSSAAQDGSIFSGIGPALVRAGLPAVVAMQYPTVQLDSAAKFSAAMYRALANGLPIDVAVNEGRNLLAAGPLLKTRDWSTPVLYLGTRSGRIIDFENENQEVVESAWENLQNAARESGALAAITQLSQRFKELADRHRRLRVLMDAADRLHNLRTGYSFLGELVDQAGGDPISLPVPGIKKAWNTFNQDYVNMLVPFVEDNQELKESAWYPKLIEKQANISAAIESLALVTLQNELNSYRLMLSEIEGRMRLQLEAAVVELVSFSDQTLPLLTVG